MLVERGKSGPKYDTLLRMAMSSEFYGSCKTFYFWINIKERDFIIIWTEHS